jgi:hypothetical protein
MEAMHAGEHAVALSMKTIASDHLDWFGRSAPSHQVLRRAFGRLSSQVEHTPCGRRMPLARRRCLHAARRALSSQPRQ